MKISVKAAVAASCAWPLLGWSQVVISGIMDAGVRLDNGTTGGSIKSQGSGLQAGSRLNFSGVEDMGGGLKAAFVLESGMAIDTGTGSANPPGAAAGSITWGRTSAVAVGSDSTGYLSMGRQYTPLWAASAGPMNDPFGGTWLGGIGSLYSFVRSASNSIVYSYGYTARAMLLPAPRNGLGVALMYAPGEVSAPLPTKSGEMLGFNLSYGNGTYWVGYAYHQQKGSNTAISATAPISDTPVGKFQTLGASYLVAGFARLHMGLNLNTNDGVGAAAVDRRNWHVGANIALGGPHTLRFLYGSADDRTAANADFKNWQLGYQYDLSKRSNIYAGAGAIKNNVNSAAILSGAVGTYAKGSTASSYIAGLRHNF
jgi:predicted porin